MDAPRYDGLLCDLDGTVYLGGRALPGVVEALALLREAGVRVLFVSNNPLRDAAAYARRLNALGIAACEHDVLTSGGVLAGWLADQHPGAAVYLLGEESLHAELTRARLRLVTRGRDAEVVVASFDRTFRYQTWTEAFEALRAGATFVATNPDATCPVDGGAVPDCGGIIAALETSSGRSVQVVAGKPAPLMVEAARARIGGANARLLVAGDRLQTDIAMGARAGVDTALVLTGVSRRCDLEEAAARPTYVLDSLAELPRVVLAGA